MMGRVERVGLTEHTLDRVTKKQIRGDVLQ